MRAILLGVLIGLALVGGVAYGLYALLGHRAAVALGQRFDVPLAPIDVPSDSASIAEGERWGWLVGCHSCHGDSLEGKVFVDEPHVMRLVAPNVASVARSYSDAELARLLRHGVTRNGTGTVAMPVAALYQLGDADVGRLIAAIRRLPPIEHRLPPTELRIFGKLAAMKGGLAPDPVALDHHAPRLGDRHNRTPEERGEYLARVICAECHGNDLYGSATSPSLVKATGYSADEFVSLMLDGRSRDGRDLALMAKTARARFVRFTREEISAIFAWLQIMPAQPAPRRPTPSLAR